MHRIFILIFLGSVFLTSEKFVNEENTIKFYFVILSLLISTNILLLKRRNIKLTIEKTTSFSIMKGLYFVGILQSLYGILQYLGKFSSNNSSFAVTGSFDNPAGFTALLSLLFPIGIFWCIKSKGIEQRFVLFSLGLILFSIIISGSRTGILAVIISSITIFAMEFNLTSKIKSLIHFKLIIFSTVCIVLIGLSLLYISKIDSANGRLLIWNISSEMVKDKPFLGFGYKGFQANYMTYQAKYFAQNPYSKFKQLADNVTHPFNEFIKITINYGAIGLLLFLLLISFIFYKLHRSRHQFKNILMGIFISFVTLSLFSYPLQYTPIWLLLSYFTLTLFTDKLPNIKFPLLIRISIIAFCLGGILLFTLKMRNEIQWKETAILSLRGDTKKTLPEYKRLYTTSLRENPMFLYNYGAELNYIGEYNQSIYILNECSLYFNDYDLQMILADNFHNMGETEKAIKIYKNASNMIPNRFMPLHHIFEIYKTKNDSINAEIMAKKIIEKEIKVNSVIVQSIIDNANNYIN